MKFSMESAEIYVPDGLAAEQALARTTHMGISAHQDDLEIMAIEGILACFHQPGKKFCGVVVTNGRGSPRAGLYENCNDDEMQAIRKVEQKKAAFVGEYGSQVLLDLPSGVLKDPNDLRAVEDLQKLFQAAHPEVVYTHNLADKHDTHVGVALNVIRVLRSLPPEMRPKQVIGCEVWRNLDWMVDSDKVIMDSSEHDNLQTALVGVFDSQVAGGKRYDLASMGRRRANATYFASHATDTASGVVFGMDLTPLILDPGLDIQGFVRGYIDHFANDVFDRIGKMI